MPSEEPLDERTIEIFQLEIRRQIMYARIAMIDITYALPEAPDRLRFFYSVDAALGALARVGDILWPAGENLRSLARARQLRERFNLGDTSVLQERGARNRFEHFAERIDTWARTSERRNFADTSLGDPRQMGLTREEIGRTYLPGTHVVEVFGAEMDLVAASHELNRIMDLVPDPHEDDHPS